MLRHFPTERRQGTESGRGRARVRANGDSIFSVSVCNVGKQETGNDHCVLEAQRLEVHVLVEQAQSLWSRVCVPRDLADFASWARRGHGLLLAISTTLEHQSSRAERSGIASPLLNWRVEFLTCGKLFHWFSKHSSSSCSARLSSGCLMYFHSRNVGCRCPRGVVG